MPKLGKLAPHPESTHPRVKLRDHLTGATPAVPQLVDWASRVTSWPMYLNDRLGDCTCAGVGHMIQAWTAYAGAEVTLPDSDILSLYEAVSGYNPTTGANDNGAVEQDVLQYLHDTGVAGHKVVAFAQVDHTNRTEVKTALDLFGSVYLGIQCPESAQSQFAAGQPWSYVPGSPIDGGHAIVLQKMDDANYYIVSWGALIEMEPAFWENYVDEAWVVVTDDWLSKNGTSPTGLNLASLTAEFQSLTGTPAPSPTPAPPHHHAKPGLFARLLTWLRSIL